MSTDRIAKLKELLNSDPSDTFALFALSMEFFSQGQLAESVEYFDRLLKIDPDYVPAYYQKAQALARMGQYRQARDTLQAGLPHAIQTGQFHARDKMQEFLNHLPEKDTAPDKDPMPITEPDSQGTDS